MGTPAVSFFEQQKYAFVGTKGRAGGRRGRGRGRGRDGGDEEGGEDPWPFVVTTPRRVNIEAEALGFERSGFFDCRLMKGGREGGREGRGREEGKERRTESALLY